MLTEIINAIEGRFARWRAWRVYRTYPQEVVNTVHLFVSMIDHGYDCTEISRIADRYVPDGYNEYLFLIDCVLCYMGYRKSGLSDEKAILCLKLDAMFKRVRRAVPCT